MVLKKKIASPKKKVIKRSLKIAPVVKAVSAKKSVSQKTIKPVFLSVPSQFLPLNQNVKTYVKNPRLWVGVAVVVVVALLYVFRGFFVAAVVNGQPILRLSVVNQLEQQNGKQVLDNLIAESLVTQEAQKEHVVVTQADIDADMKKIEDTLKQQGTTLDVALAARGLTQSQLVDQIRLQKMLDKMVGTSVKISDADVQSYIDKNQDSLPKGLSDADLKAQVRQQLEQQALQSKTQTFLANLQKKAQVQYFVNY